MKRKIFIGLLFITISLAACSPAAIEKSPAAQDCEANGGKVEIRNENGQAVGYCVFPDGSECSETDYENGTCEYQQEELTGAANPASVFCEEQGGTLEMRTDDEGNETGYCVFYDGSECEEWAYFNGECKPWSEAILEAPPESADLGSAYVNSAELKLEGQLTVVIKGDLPDPCHRLYVNVEEPDANNNINITTSSWFEDQGFACAQVLQEFEAAVEIPTENLPDGVYTVFVDGEEIGSFQSTN